MRYCAAGNKHNPIFMGPADSRTLDRTIFEHIAFAFSLVHFDLNEFWSVPLFYIFSSRRSFRIVFLRPRPPILVWFLIPLLYIKKTSQIGLWGVDYCFDPTGIYRVFLIFFTFPSRRWFYFFLTPASDCDFTVFWKPSEHTFRPISASPFPATFFYACDFTCSVLLFRDKHMCFCPFFP